MLNKLTLTLTNDGEIQVLASIAAEVPKDGHSQVSIVEYCLAKAPSFKDGPKGYTVDYAKAEYVVNDTAIFAFNDYEDTEALTAEFAKLLKSNPDLDREDVISAAVFMDLLSETLIDVEDGEREGQVAIVSTLLEETEDAR